MSDTLQLVVVLHNTQPERNAEHSLELSVGRHDDKLKRIGHSVEQFPGA